MEGGGGVFHLCEINATAMRKKTSVSQEVRVRLEVVRHEAVKTRIPARGVYGREEVYYEFQLNSTEARIVSTGLINCEKRQYFIK